MIVGRGGGALEDLMAFNDEALVRQIFAYPLPIISAVGHQTDTSLVDFVADLSAPTPTAAAEMVAPSQEDIALQLDDYQKTLRRVCQQQLLHNQQRLNQYKLSLQQPLAYFSHYRHHLQTIATKLHQQADTQLNQLKKQHLLLKNTLSQNNPRKILNQGFALISQHKKIVQSAQQLTTDQPVVLQFADGKANATIKNITLKKLP